MALYELRTYELYVGKLQDAVKLYQDMAWPVFEAGGYDAKLVGYFVSDVGTLNSIVHMWKFEDDVDRRAHWASLFSNDDFMAFAAQFRPLVMKQENQLLQAAPWGPHP